MFVSQYRVRVLPFQDCGDDLIQALARIIHERFYFNRGFAAATSPDAVARHPDRRARRSVGRHTVLSMPPFLAAPRACLAWRLRDFATNRHE
jgi:hypothetical protein